MELELKELGLTLALGGLAFFGFWQVFRIIVVSKQPSKHLDEMVDEMPIWKKVAFFALIFALGIFLEDYSKDISAERTPEAHSAFFSHLDTDHSLRLKSLFDVNGPTDSSIVATQTSIFMDLDKLKSGVCPDPQFVLHMNKIDDFINAHTNLDLKGNLLLKTTDVVTNFVTGIVTTDNVARCKSEVNLVYEIAKNRVYMDEAYNHELQEIYGRVAFARSCAFLGIILGVIFATLSGAAVIAYCMERSNKKAVKDFDVKWLNHLSTYFFVLSAIAFFYWDGYWQLLSLPLALLPVVCSKQLRKQMVENFKAHKQLIGLVICAAGFYLVRETFRDEHKSMDLRVMGYYMTLNNDFRNEQAEDENCCRPSCARHSAEGGESKPAVSGKASLPSGGG